MQGERTRSIKTSFLKNKSLVILNEMLLIFILLLIWIKPIDKLKDYDIERQISNDLSTELIYGPRNILQTFICEEYADSFEISITAANGSYHGIYNVNLYNEKGALIQTWETDKLDLTEEWIEYKLSGDGMDKGEIYCIEVTAPQLKKATAIKVKLTNQSEKWSDEEQAVYGDRNLYIDGQATDKTLCFAVYKSMNNVYAWAAVIILFLTMNFWWIHKDEAVEKNALIILAGLGTVMFLCFTPGSGPDDDYHYYSAYEISNIILGVENVGQIDERYAEIFSVHDNSNEKFVYIMENILCKEKLDATGNIIEFNGHKDLLGAPTSHLIPALGIVIARLLNMNIAQLYSLARLFNLLFYIIIAFVAIKLVPLHKELMLMISIMPMALHQAVQISYDVVINGLSLVFVAYILKIVWEKKTVGWRNVFACVTILGIFSPIKVVYCVLALLFIVIPKEQFQSVKDKTVKLFTVVLGTFFIVLITKWEVLTSVLSGTSKRTITDTYSLSFVLEHPMRLLKYIFQSFERHGWLYIEGAVGDELAGRRVSVPEYLIVGFMLLIVLCAVNEEKEKMALSGWQKVTGVSVSLMGAVLVISAAFAWTPYGAEYANGVQGRYFIPFLAPLLFCLCEGKLAISMDKHKMIIPLWFIEAGYIVSILSQVAF